jgi:trimeric autotransporter adhesin
MKKITINFLKSIFILNLVFYFQFSNAQVGIGTTAPNASSILDVVSTNKGLLIPRVTLTSTTSPSPLLSHVAGMQVYNTVTAGDVTPAQYYNDGTKWIKIADASVKNYTFLRTSDNLPSDISGDQSVSVYRIGQTAIGNVHTDGNVYYGLTPTPTPLGRTLFSAVKNFNTADQFPVGGTQIAGQFTSLIDPPAGSNSTDSGGIVGRVYTAANTNNYSKIYGGSISAYHSGTGTVTEAFGNLFTVTNNTTGAIANAYGIQADLNNASSGTITNSIGINQNTVNTGTIGTNIGLNVNRSGTGSFTNNYGVRIQDVTSGATTSSYGLYIDDIKGTNVWGVYQAHPSDKNYLAGHTAIGNFQSDPEAGYNAAAVTRLASTVLNVYENFNTSVGYNTKENVGIASSVILNMPAGNTHVYSKAVVGSVTIPATSTLPFSVIDGANFRAYNLGSGTVGQLIGTINTARNIGSGAVTDVTAIRNSASNLGTSTVNDMIGDLATLETAAGSGLVSNAYGFKVGTGAWVGPPATNYYGLHLEPGKGTNNYAIYTNDGYVRLGGLPVYNTDAAAGVGGVPSNVLYRTTTGEIRVKL